VKSEPFKYSWDDLVRDGSTYWDGVRNALARIHLQAMRRDDRVLYYHSNVGKEVVGIAKVTKAAYPDPTSDDSRWVVVDLVPVKALKQPVTLAQIKTDASLADIPLVKQSRLSVMPIPRKAFDRIVALGAAPKANARKPARPRIRSSASHRGPGSR
jgi:predicted RNA-binding protein with PUA-like domain